MMSYDTINYNTLSDAAKYAINLQQCHTFFLTKKKFHGVQNDVKNGKMFASNIAPGLVTKSAVKPSVCECSLSN